MALPPHHPDASVEMEGLHAAVAALLGQRRGGSSSPVRVACSPYATKCPAYVLRVGEEAGGELSLFVKRLPYEVPRTQPPSVPQEVLIYEQLLDTSDLPVPRYYGCSRDAGSKAYLLVLEHVDGWNLVYHDVGLWLTAVRAVARIHAHFASLPRRLSSCPSLPRSDDRARGVARRAQAAVGRWPGLARALAPAVDREDLVRELTAAQPPTLVHGDLAPKNVIASAGPERPRTWVVDWEYGAAGCGVADLVHLKHGLALAEDAAMVAAYREELAETGLLPASEPEFNRLLAACEVQHRLQLLELSPLWDLPVETIRRWIEEVRRFLSAV